MKLFDHPGNLGSIRGTVITVLHTDWPTYPLGENFMEGLFQLTAFPEGTEFLVIDDIDRVLLFVANIKGLNSEDKFDNRNLHVAIWHDDLATLQKKGLIDGIELATEQKWREVQWQQVQSQVRGRPICRKGPAGNFVEPEGPKPGEYDDDPDEKPFVTTSNGRIAVTGAGRAFVRRAISSQGFDIAEAISTKVAKLFDLKFFDTCVREACVQLEHEMKSLILSDAYGDRLVSDFLEWLKEHRTFLESQQRTFRQEIRIALCS